MNPEQALRMARFQQQDFLRHAAAAHRAGEVPTPTRGRQIRLAMPRFELGRRIASVRMRLAHA